MIRSGTITVLIRYADMLQQFGATPHRSTDDFMADNHLLWMCNNAVDQLLYNSDSFPIDKASRWLGYIQGIMTSKGYIDVMVERNFTRPLFT